MSLADKQLLDIGRTSDGRLELTLAGEIDVCLAAELQHAAMQLAQPGDNVVINCGQVTALHIAALQILIALTEALRVQGRTCQIMNLSADLAATVARVGLGRYLELAC